MLRGNVIMTNQKKIHSVQINQSDFESRDDTTVTWLGGSGFLINCSGTIILIDPLLSVKPEDPELSECGLKLKIRLPLLAEQVAKADYVLYTHADIDHLGPITALTLAKLNPRFIGTYPVYYQLTQLGVNPKRVSVCRVGEKIDVDGILVQITPADHPWQLQAIERGGRPYRMGECCGYILNTKDGRIFFPGDTRLMEEHLDIKDIDLLVLDVSKDEYHLNHVSAAVLANNLPNAYLFPTHYGTYYSDKPAHIGEPGDVYPKISNANQRGLLLSPGEPFVVKSFKE